MVHPPGQEIGAHRHDWPLLTIPALGGYSEECEDGVRAIDGPAAILHPAGRCHANCIHARGMETFSIEFDPDWLKPGLPDLRLDRSHYWIGGEVALASRRLARLWHDSTARDRTLKAASGAFLQAAIMHRPAPAPRWLGRARRLIDQGECNDTLQVARRLGLHPAWLGHAYRSAAGEGLHETVMRRRVESAVTLLRATRRPIADIAFATGFCDQSHLNRVMRRWIGRTPLQVRAEAARLQSAVDG